MNNNNKKKITVNKKVFNHKCARRESRVSEEIPLSLPRCSVRPIHSIKMIDWIIKVFNFFFYFSLDLFCLLFDHRSMDWSGRRERAHWLCSHLTSLARIQNKRVWLHFVTPTLYVRKQWFSSFSPRRRLFLQQPSESIEQFPFFIECREFSFQVMQE